jgi:Zn-dependent protease/CBS domain-containing protein
MQLWGTMNNADNLVPDGSQARVPREAAPFNIAGIRMKIDYSWLVIFLLVLWGLAAGYLPAAAPGHGPMAYWVAGVIATLCLFGAVLVHELAHALVAKRLGTGVREITLFFGVSETLDEPRDAWTEARIAGVGPALSIVLGLAFWGLYQVFPGNPEGLVRAVVGYLAVINGAVAAFNLLPGFPLDGGRLLRAGLAWWTGSQRWATKVAANVGQGLALGLIVLGALNLFGGALMGGVWLVLIGLALRGMAVAGFQSLVIRQALEDVTVEDVMVRDVVTVAPDLSLRALVDDYLLGYGYHGFPVVEDGQVEGIISVADVRRVPPAEREHARVVDSMQHIGAQNRVEPDAPLVDAIRKMTAEDVPQLVVTHDGELDGLLTRTALVRFVEMRQALAA